jgi:hypothetical protein
MSEKRIVRAAAVQISPDFERSDGTLNKVCEAIDQAARLKPSCRITRTFRSCGRQWPPVPIT